MTPRPPRFDAGRYEEALAAYEALAADAPDGFADVPVVGRAQCLEAMSKFEEAQKAFDAFAEANPTNYLTLTAQLGAARCIAQSGDKKKALARIEAIRAANKGDEVASARIDAAESLIKRFEKGKPVAAEAKPAAGACCAEGASRMQHPLDERCGGKEAVSRLRRLCR